jgi:hypothetical protein
VTARGSRSIFSTPDAVTDLRDLGDRLDVLERIPAAENGSLVDAWAWNLELPPDGSNVFAGRLTLPAGFSKIEFLGSFLADGELLVSAGVPFEAPFEATNVVAGGITTGSPLTSAWQAAGFVLARTSGTKKVRFYARGTSQSSPGVPGSNPIRAIGALFVQPIRSVAFEG